jgi:hypothetical protein
MPQGNYSRYLPADGKIFRWRDGKPISGQIDNNINISPNQISPNQNLVRLVLLLLVKMTPLIPILLKDSKVYNNKDPTNPVELQGITHYTLQSVLKIKDQCTPDQCTQ